MWKQSDVVPPHKHSLTCRFFVALLYQHWKRINQLFFSVSQTVLSRLLANLSLTHSPAQHQLIPSLSSQHRLSSIMLKKMEPTLLTPLLSLLSLLYSQLPSLALFFTPSPALSSFYLNSLATEPVDVEFVPPAGGDAQRRPLVPVTACPSHGALHHTITTDFCTYLKKDCSEATLYCISCEVSVEMWWNHKERSEGEMDVGGRGGDGEGLFLENSIMK